jgi:hypothetical protein
MPYLLPLPTLEAFWHDSLYWLRTQPGAGAGATATDIAQWEARTGFALPESLGAMYAQRNGGVSDWLNAVMGPEGPISLSANFGNHWSPLAGAGPLRSATLGEISDGIDFGDDDEDEDGASYRHAFGSDADRLWAVANYGSSQYLLLDYRRGAQPAVTLFDDDSRFYGDAGVIKGAGLYVLARSFDDFLRNCRRLVAHPLRVWSADGIDATALAQDLAGRLQATSQPARRMAMDTWHRQYGEKHLHLPDPHLAEQFQPDFGEVHQYSGGLLGEAVLRTYRNRSAQGTRAERFAGDDAVLVSLLLPTAEPALLPADASDTIETAFAQAGMAWRRWLDTDAADFVAEDAMLTPYIDHPSSDGSLSSAKAEAA